MRDERVPDDAIAALGQDRHRFFVSPLNFCRHQRFVSMAQLAHELATPSIRDGAVACGFDLVA